MPYGYKKIRSTYLPSMRIVCIQTRQINLELHYCGKSGHLEVPVYLKVPVYQDKFRDMESK